MTRFSVENAFLTTARTFVSGTGMDGTRDISSTRLWQHVCESYMSGAFHAIGARISALAGIAQMARMDDLDRDLVALLDDEIGHLTDVAEAVRVLPRATTGGDEPTRLASCVPPVLRLFEMSLDARDLEIRYEGPEEGLLVDMDATSLAHALSILILCLGWHACRSNLRAITVRLRVTDRIAAVEGRVERAGTGPVGGEVLPDEADGDVVEEGLETIARAVAAAGGRLEIDGPSPLSRFRLELPALT